MGNYCPSLEQCAHRLKPCYLNLGKVQSKVLATGSNIHGLQNKLDTVEPP